MNPKIVDIDWNPVTLQVLRWVSQERYRQELLREQGKFQHTCASKHGGFSQEGKLAILAEEFGEVARHVTEQIIDPQRLQKDKLRAELIQVAAVAVAWAESLEG